MWDNDTQSHFVRCILRGSFAGVTGHTPKSVEQILNRYLVRASALAAAVAKRLELGNEIAALVEVDEQDHVGDDAAEGE